MSETIQSLTNNDEFTQIVGNNFPNFYSQNFAYFPRSAAVFYPQIPWFEALNHLDRGLDETPNFASNFFNIVSVLLDSEYLARINDSLENKNYDFMSSLITEFIQNISSELMKDNLHILIVNRVKDYEIINIEDTSGNNFEVLNSINSPEIAAINETGLTKGIYIGNNDVLNPDSLINYSIPGSSSIPPVILMNEEHINKNPLAAIITLANQIGHIWESISKPQEISINGEKSPVIPNTERTSSLFGLKMVKLLFELGINNGNIIKKGKQQASIYNTVVFGKNEN